MYILLQAGLAPWTSSAGSTVKCWHIRRWSHIIVLSLYCVYAHGIAVMSRSIFESLQLWHHQHQSSSHLQTSRLLRCKSAGVWVYMYSIHVDLINKLLFFLWTQYQEQYPSLELVLAATNPLQHLLHRLQLHLSPNQVRVENVHKLM